MESSTGGGPSRIQRSLLAVPATSDHFFLKAARGPADAIFLDLEDAVAPARRDEARTKAITALTDIDWGRKTVTVRVNGLRTKWALQDILTVARCPRLDTVLVPKVESPEDVAFVDRLLTALEMEQPRERPLGIEILVETTRGLTNVEAIAASSARLEAIAFGVVDYSIDLESLDTVLGVSMREPLLRSREADQPLAGRGSDPWHFARARIANACRAFGLRPIDGPHGDYSDAEGFRTSCGLARALGFEGKLVVHPSQVPLANELFSPTAAQIVWAREIVSRMEEAAAKGQGAIGVDNKLIDLAHVKLARKILRRAALSGADKALVHLECVQET